MIQKPQLLTRRSALKRLLASFGGAMTVAQIDLLTRASAAMTEDSAPTFFDKKQFATLARIVDLIIPETDTPGALTVGVHHFIDLMFAEWASEDRKARWVEGLADIEGRSKALGMNSFYTGSATQQTELLQALDKESFAQGDDVTFFSELKKMVLFAFYSSETGATVELKYQAIPGDYLPCVPMDEIGRAWFWNGYSYEL